MHRVLVLVPFAFGEEGVANREAAKQWVELGPDIQFDFRPVKAGPEMYDSYHDWLLADMSMYEAGITAQDEGYDAVVLDAMNDPGMSALRSILDIPVIGPGRASYLETPASIRSNTTRESRSRSAKCSYVASLTSRDPSAVRTRGRSTWTRRPPSVTSPDSRP